jgi:hypothetical protein
MNEKNAAGLSKWLTLDDLSQLAMLANENEKPWVAPILRQRLNAALARRAVSPAQASSYMQAAG